MNKQLSIYLDLLRFTAASLVFISHVPGFSGGWLWQLTGFGHEAVVFFFVLSGFVIAYVVFEKKEGALKYVVNRLARIYSVAIPALILTLILYYAGHTINAKAFHHIDEMLLNPYWTISAALVFINQSWVATPIFSNLPYWSLGYEVLYYIFFGVFLFVKGRKKYFFLLVVIAIMGPSILLYLPVWLMGVACFILARKYPLSVPPALFIYILSIIGIIVFSFNFIPDLINGFLLDSLGNNLYELLLDPAGNFGSDYFLALFVALHIYSSVQLGKAVIVFNSFFQKTIRNIASHTFSLYLYHLPILYFISAAIPYDRYPVLNLLACWILTPIFILLLSTYTENKKKTYQAFFHSLLCLFSRKDKSLIKQ